MYGKATETAIAAMTRLAEVYDGGRTRLSASEIAENRRLALPFVRKVLTTLAQHGLVTGTRGPGGGFALAREPASITVHDVFRLFEREEQIDTCPFGGGVCGIGDPCPLHDKLVAVQEAIGEVLHETNFEAFRKAFQEDGLRPAVRDGPVSPRESFRAPPISRRSGKGRAGK